MSARRGSSLLTVVLVLLVAVTLIFMVASSSVMHLRFSTAVSARQHARNLAESALNEALARVLSDDSFGRSHSAGQSVTVTGPSYPEGAYGFQSFNPGEAGGQSSYYSTNNLNGTSSIPGDRRAVPRGTVHLVGVGKCADVTQTVECLYYRPPFPRALAASGPIVADSGLQVTGLRAGANYPGTPGAILPEDRALGSVLSNNSSTDAAHPALHLGPNCRVDGDAGAVGAVDLDPSVFVGGEVRSGTEPQALPNFDVDAMIAQVQGITGTLYLSGTTGATTIDWFDGCDGDLTINGDLTLTQGVLWVRQNLHVTGAIKGTGIVLVKGNVQVDAGTQLSSTNLVAIAAGGDVTLLAAGQNSYYFQGLIYSQGNVVARDITVLGSIITNSAPGKGRMDLHNVNMVTTPQSISEIAVGVPVPTYRGPGYNHGPENHPDGPFFSCAVHLDPVTGVRLYTVRCHTVPPMVAFDRTWTNCTYEQLRDPLYHEFESGSLHFLPHNQANRDTVVRVMDAVHDIPLPNPSIPNELNLSLNNLMTQADKSRVLLWRMLP